MKSILITGVCGGMGYAAARQFAQAGFRVFGIDRRPSIDLPICGHRFGAVEAIENRSDDREEMH